MQLMAKKKPEQQDAKKREGHPISLWVSPDVFAKLEEFRAAQRVPPNRTDVLELSLMEFLEREGYPVAKPKD